MKRSLVLASVIVLVELLVLFSAASHAAAEDVEVTVSANGESPDGWWDFAVDGNTKTAWKSAWHDLDRRRGQHEIELTFSTPIEMSGVTLIPSEEIGAGALKEYDLHVDGQRVLEGTLDPTGPQKITFPEKRTGSRLKLYIRSSHDKLPWVSIAEIKVETPSRLVPTTPTEERVKWRDELIRRGRRPAEDNVEDWLDLSIRTLGMLERDGGQQRQFSDRLKSYVQQYGQRGNDGRLRDDLKHFRREMILTHPKLQFSQLLINKRPPPGYSHQCDQYLGRHGRLGPGLCVLEDWKKNPRCREILSGKMPAGTTMHPEIDYDAKKVVFSFCDHERTENKNERAFFIWEANLDGSGLRQLTGDEDDSLAGWENRATVLPEDFDPCYLPDGDIVFVSTRSQTFGRCHGDRYVPTYLVYRMDRDGKTIRQLSAGEANEWDPSVLPNGRVVYTRWDYINRHDVKFQSLWSMQPDGTGVAHYHGNYSPSPCMQAECRAIPGTKKTVFTASAHHSYTHGSVLICDPVRGEDGYEPLTRVTPEVAIPEASDPHGGDGNHGAYSMSWPITEEIYLASFKRANHTTGQGGTDPDNAWEIVLIDTLGGRETIYRDPNMSSLSPIPIVRRERPRMVPSQLNANSTEETGTFYVQNVYMCREPFEPGTAKYMRINRIHGQVTNSKPWLSTANNEIIKSVVGMVPINGDGSVAFRAPAGVPLQLQVCDQNGMAVMTMRSFVFLHKGEVASCTGCHEPRDQVPTTKFNYARIRVQDPTPPPGPQYDGGLSFQRTVQPVLDRYCIGCHGLKNDRPKGIELIGRRDGNALRSFNCLTNDRDLVKVAYRNEETGYSTPKEYYAHAGRLANHLLTNEECLKNVRLPREDFLRIVNWLDLNAQYYGDYSRNRIEDRRIDGNAESLLREAVKARFGDEIARQPIETLVNIAQPNESRVLLAGLQKHAGGWEQFKNCFGNKNEQGYKDLDALVVACITKRSRFDVMGTCGDPHGCSCGGCWTRRLQEKRMYPVVEREWPTFDQNLAEGAEEMPIDGWRLVSVDSEETVVANLAGQNAIDGDDSTYWCTEFTEDQPLPPHEIVIDLGKEVNVCAIRYLPREGLGDIRDCEIYIGRDVNRLGEPVLAGRFNDSRDRQTASLEKPVKGRYVKIRSLREMHDSLYMSAREISVMTLTDDTLAMADEEK